LTAPFSPDTSTNNSPKLYTSIFVERRLYCKKWGSIKPHVPLTFNVSTILLTI
jgi:hypothetical protein